MKHKKYSSIKRALKSGSGNPSDFLKYLIENGYSTMEGTLEEKVHGANFQVSYDGENFQYGSRTLVLTKESNFYGNRYLTLVKPYLEAFKAIFEELKVPQVTFYAELAGGLRDEESKCSVVQRGTNYCADQFLIFFDIRIFKEGDDKGTLINPDESKALFLKNKILHAPVIKRGPILKLLKGLKYGDSGVTRALNPEGELNSILEGYVLKSMETQYIGDDRIVMKLINPMYEEVVKRATTGKSQSRVEVELDLGVSEYIGKAKDYITDMRLDKVCGNIGISGDNFEGKLFRSVQLALFEDVVKDMKEDKHELKDSDYNLVLTKLNQELAKVVRAKFF